MSEWEPTGRPRGPRSLSRYYILGDAGTFFFDPAGDNDGFGSPEAAAEWATTQHVVFFAYGAPRQSSDYKAEILPDA